MLDIINMSDISEISVSGKSLLTLVNGEYTVKPEIIAITLTA